MWDKMEFYINIKDCTECPYHQNMKIEGLTVDYCKKYRIFGDKQNFRRLCEYYYRYHNLELNLDELKDIDSIEEGLTFHDLNEDYCTCISERSTFLERLKERLKRW